MFLSIKRAFYIVCMCVHTCTCSILFIFVCMCVHTCACSVLYSCVCVCTCVPATFYIVCVSVCVHMCACSVEFFGAGATGVCKQPNMDARI